MDAFLIHWEDERGIELVYEGAHNGADGGADDLAPELRIRSCTKKMTCF